MRTNSRVLLLIAVATGCGLAQTIARDSKTAVKETSNIAGVVTNAVTGQPIERAHVIAFGWSDNRSYRFGAMSDTDGRFSIRDLPAIKLNFQVVRVGFTAMEDIVATWDFKPGERKEDFEFLLTPVGSITGRILDADGEPVEGVIVSARPRLLGIEESTTSDELGRFRIGGLRPGKYWVKASPEYPPLPLEIRSDGTVEMQNAATLYPGSLEPGSAARVAVRPGAETSGIDIRLVPVPVLCISGRASGSGRINDRIVLVARRGALRVREISAATDGSFRLCRLNPGSYTLIAETRSLDSDRRRAEIEVELGSRNIENLELRVVPAAELVGTVTFVDNAADGLPPAGQVRVPSTGSVDATRSRQLVLRAIDGEWHEKRVDLAENGSFRADSVPAGRYRVSLSWDAAYVKSMRLGDREMPGGNLDLSTGAGGATLTIAVGSQLGTLNGSVREASEATGVQVVLAAVDQSRERIVAVGADGSYTIQFPPGKYRLVAFDARSKFYGGHDLSNFGDAVQDVEIRVGETVTRDLKLATVE